MSRRDLATELPGALERNEIVPFFQPIVDLHTLDIVGFEILARWRHADRKIIPPVEFIPVAEEVGLIGSLTESLLHQACVAARRWPRDLHLSVNISPIQLLDPLMAERLYGVAEQAQFPFHRLTFEVTESVEIQDLETARQALGELKSFGAQIALDDFGTGYSGLRYLQLLPFDMLKLDAQFIRSMSSHRESRKIVCAVMGLCHTLGLTGIAEGIEDHEQLEMLRSLGYNKGQGYLFGRPVPADQVSPMLQNTRLRPISGTVASIAEHVALRLEAMPIQCLWQLRALYEGAPVGLALVDTNLRYLAVNERLAEMHRLPVARFIGRRLLEVIPELIDQVEPRIRRALAGETLKDIETRYRPQGPDALVLRTSYQPVHDAAGEIVGVSVAVVDIAGHGLAPKSSDLEAHLLDFED